MLPPLNDSDILRAARIIRGVISDLKLDLTDLTVLTEVGSGYFAFTPLIALMANAKRVFAWTRDSTYGSGAENVATLTHVLQILQVYANIEFAVNERPAAHVGLADIITNSGFVRPLDKELLAKIGKNNVAIPLMFEKWELREDEIDVDFCRNAGIQIAGTWENHPSLGVFEYCGPLAAKMCFNAGSEICGNHIIVWSNDPFGDVIENTFKKLGAATVRRTTRVEDLYTVDDPIDLLFFCDYHDRRSLIGKGGLIDLGRLQNASPGVKIVHLIGEIDPASSDSSIEIYPIQKGRQQAMTFTLASLGMIPLIKLQAGGLKVGECLIREISSTLCQPII
jgi:hypothetical protein